MSDRRLHADLFFLLILKTFVEELYLSREGIHTATIRSEKPQTNTKCIAGNIMLAWLGSAAGQV